MTLQRYICDCGAVYHDLAAIDACQARLHGEGEIVPREAVLVEALRGGPVDFDVGEPGPEFQLNKE